MSPKYTSIRKIVFFIKVRHEIKKKIRRRKKNEKESNYRRKGKWPTQKTFRRQIKTRWKPHN